jgi:hypothetical protein
LDDSLDPRAAVAQADALALDPDVMAVLGPFESATAQAVAPTLAHAGTPALLAAPLTDPPAGIRSLCPSPEALRQAQLEVARQVNALAPFSGDAASAADVLGQRSVSLVGGPDVFRPWLIQRAGSAAEGVRASACAPEGMGLDDLSEGDASLGHAAELADFGTHVLLEALAADIAAHGRPTRPGVTAALSQKPPAPGLAWYGVERGKWTLYNSPANREKGK